MLQITWLGHSGFLLETTGRRMVFDLFLNTHIIESLPLDGKPLIFFASHNHGDHYNPKIFDYPGSLYVLSSDIPLKKLSVQQPVEQIAPGETLDRNGLHIEAFGSTDKGVSFRVTVDGFCIFHAGDLNCWYWADESTEKELAEDYAAWQRELARLDDKTAVDVACFPVDPRLGDFLAKGALEYVNAICPRRFVPMHYSEGNVEVAATLGDIAAAGTEVLFPTQPGWSRDIG